MPMNYGFKAHTSGRYFHFQLRTTGFLFKFESNPELISWLQKATSEHPRFRIKSTDLIRVKESTTDNVVKMVHQVKGL